MMKGRERQKGDKGSFTLRPITPRQAIEGIRVAILRGGGVVWGYLFVFS